LPPHTGKAADSFARKIVFVAMEKVLKDVNLARMQYKSVVQDSYYPIKNIPENTLPFDRGANSYKENF